MIAHCGRGGMRSESRRPDGRNCNVLIPDDFDIIVAGGGLAGKLAAVVLGDSGFRVACCEPRRQGSGSRFDRDNRVTALLGPARDILRKTAVWEHVRESVLPLASLRIVDSGEDPPQTCSVHDFNSSEIGKDCFGWTVLNTELHAALDNRISELGAVTMIYGSGVDKIVPRREIVCCRLASGKRICGRLLVAADGRNSGIRVQAGIAIRRSIGNRSALSFNINHKEPHAGVTTEYHGQGESVTFIPLPGAANQNASSVVWVLKGTMANELNRMSEHEFNMRLQRKTVGQLGQVHAAGRRMVWPVVSQVARRFDAERVVLIGETAHVLSPVGAQGLNTTLADIAALVAVTGKDRKDPGSRRVVAEYGRGRRADVLMRIAATEVLGQAATTDLAFVRQARKMGLRAVNGQPQVKRGLMKLGMGSPPSGFSR